MNLKSARAIAEARIAAGLTQRELAAGADTTQPIVARLEAGIGNPTIGTLERLVGAAGFELSIDIVPRTAPDPVVDAYRRDVDRTLLRENLKKTPGQRVRGLVAMARFVDEAQRSRRPMKRK
jgi:transcriptional regulator with XRE-family HTH domain